MRKNSLAGFLVLFLSMPACTASRLAQPTDAAAGPKSLDVSATAEVQAQPDLAFVEFAVETFAASAKVAASQNAERMQQVLSTLKKAGVPRDALETGRFAVYPEYEPNRPEPADGSNRSRVRGYRASNVVTLEVQDLSRLGPLIDQVTGAGANRVSQVRFALRTPEAVRARALGRAVEHARTAAEAMASAMGLKLGDVLSASSVPEPGGGPPFRQMSLDVAESATGAPTPILPGPQTVSATATVTYRLEPTR